MPPWEGFPRSLIKLAPIHNGYYQSVPTFHCIAYVKVMKRKKRRKRYCPFAYGIDNCLFCGIRMKSSRASGQKSIPPRLSRCWNLTAIDSVLRVLNLFRAWRKAIEYMSTLKKATAFSQIQPLINRTQDKSGRRGVTAKECFKGNTTQIFPDTGNLPGAVVHFRLVNGTGQEGPQLEITVGKMLNVSKESLTMGQADRSRGCCAPGLGEGPSTDPLETC